MNWSVMSMKETPFDIRENTPDLCAPGGADPAHQMLVGAFQPAWILMNFSAGAATKALVKSGMMTNCGSTHMASE